MVLFGNWLAQTDVMFGHYEGPAVLVIASTGVLLPGVLLSLVWFGGAISNRLRGRRDPNRKAWPGLLAGVLIAVLLVPAAVFLFFSSLVAIDKLAKTPTGKFLVNSYTQWAAGPAHPVDKAETLDELAPFLKDGDEEVRLTAVHRLGELEPPAPAAVEALRSVKDDPVPLVRVYVAEALWKLTASADEPVALLIDVLESGDEEGYAEHTALSKLADMGPVADAAIPTLENMARTDSRPAIQRDAAAVLGHIRAEDASDSP